MDYAALAELLFPHIDKTPDYYEALYPARQLPPGAKVTRLGPSPTGFIHLGNLYVAFEREAGSPERRRFFPSHRGHGRKERSGRRR